LTLAQIQQEILSEAVPGYFCNYETTLTLNNLYKLSLHWRDGATATKSEFINCYHGNSR